MKHLVHELLGAAVMGDEHVFKYVDLMGLGTKLDQTCTCSIEHVDVVLVDQQTLREAQEWLTGCEQCTEDAPITFDYLLDALTGCSPAFTEYIMCHPAKCPVCRSAITEKTLVVVA